ncbi:MAG: 2Fe-2S iron-sulfur cluster binding domain-containing protein [Planctomycetes bacterium]|nr:2Fe-2S iron-sulfur cluster binding domain-containing protein [Planctomycetota bacterium]
MTRARLIVHGDSGPKELELAVGQSILDAALSQGVDLDHACGGVCACSTCHVKVREGFDCFPEATDDELDQLDEARDVGLDSRLACQAKLERVPEGGKVEVVIPAWNVNMAKEGH